MNPEGGALMCVTDLEDCCDAPRTVRGDWYFPDGHRVPGFYTAQFLANRGPNEVINEQRIYGSVRLYRKSYRPNELGLFTGSTATTTGERDYSLMYSAILVLPPPGVPSPSFQWFFYGRSSLLVHLYGLTGMM